MPSHSAQENSGQNNKQNNRKKYFVGPLRVKSTGYIFDKSFSQHMQ